MTDDLLRATLESYLDAFFEPSPTEREKLLRANVDEDVAFSNPGVDGRGLNTLLGHITRFQSGSAAGASGSTGTGSNMGRCWRSGPSSTKMAPSSSPPTAMRGSAPTAA